MNVDAEAEFTLYMEALAAKRGLWVYTVEDLLKSAFTHGIYLESRGLI